MVLTTSANAVAIKKNVRPLNIAYSVANIKIYRQF